MTTHSERLERVAMMLCVRDWCSCPYQRAHLVEAKHLIAAYLGDDGPLLAINRKRLAGYIHSDKSLFLQTLKDLQNAGVIVRLGGGDS